MPRSILVALAAALVVLGSVLSVSAQQVTPPSLGDQQCTFDGLWNETTYHWTTRFEQPGRFRTWNGDAPIDETESPAATGSIEHARDRVVFNYDNQEGSGYAYRWRFEDGCAVLVLELLSTHGSDSPGLVYRLLRVAGR